MIVAPSSQIPPDYNPARVIERPDGFYWQDELTDKFFGPFPTRLEAVQDMQSQDDTGDDFDEGESLEDAEAEIGISSWIDPETGDPAEGFSPRFSDE